MVGLEVAILKEWNEPPGRAKCNKLAMGNTGEIGDKVTLDKRLIIDKVFLFKLNSYDVRTGKMGISEVNDFRGVLGRR